MARSAVPPGGLLYNCLFAASALDFLVKFIEAPCRRFSLALDLLLCDLTRWIRCLLVLAGRQGGRRLDRL